MYKQVMPTFDQTYFGRYFWFRGRIHDGLCKEKLPDLILLFKQYKKKSRDKKDIPDGFPKLKPKRRFLIFGENKEKHG